MICTTSLFSMASTRGKHTPLRFDLTERRADISGCRQLFPSLGPETCRRAAFYRRVLRSDEPVPGRHRYGDSHGEEQSRQSGEDGNSGFGAYRPGSNFSAKISYQGKNVGLKSGHLSKLTVTGTQAILYFDLFAPQDTVKMKYRLRAKYSNESDLAKYEVMDAQQRITAIFEHYTNRYRLA
jgi:hypothetical protein